MKRSMETLFVVLLGCVLVLSGAFPCLGQEQDERNEQPKAPFNQADFPFELPPPEAFRPLTPAERMAESIRMIQSIENPRLVAGIEQLTRWLTDDDSPFDLDALELVDDQRQEIHQLRAQWEQEREELQQKIEATTNADKKKLLEYQLGEREREFCKQLVEVLLPDQLDQLPTCRLSNGVKNVLIDSLVGEDLGLTDEQRERITERSHELAKEIEAFAAETRRKRYEIIVSELTEKQRARLVELYGLESIKKAFAGASLKALHSDLVDREQVDDRGGERYLPDVIRWRLQEPSKIDFKELEQSSRVNR